MGRDERAFRAAPRRAGVITLRMRDSSPATGLSANAITVYSNLHHRHLRADKSRR